MSKQYTKTVYISVKLPIAYFTHTGIANDFASSMILFKYVNHQLILALSCEVSANCYKVWHCISAFNNAINSIIYCVMLLAVWAHHHYVWLIMGIMYLNWWQKNPGHTGSGPFPIMVWFFLCRAQLLLMPLIIFILIPFPMYSVPRIIHILDSSCLCHFTNCNNCIANLFIKFIFYV